MPSELELRSGQKSVLYTLLEVKYDADKSGVRLLSLNRAISNQQAIMQPEDVTYVKDQIAKREQ